MLLVEAKAYLEWNGIKNSTMQVIYFLNGPMANLLLYCHIFIYREKVTS